MFKLSSLLVKFKLLVGDPNRQRLFVRKKLMPLGLVVAVASALWPGLLLLRSDPLYLPAPWLQQYVVLHQVGWWDFPSFFRGCTVLLLDFLVAPVPPEWPDFLILYISDFRFFSSPWSFLKSIFRSMLSASLVGMRLAYRATCSVSVLLAVVRLVSAALSSDVACSRLANVMYISVKFFAEPVCYPPCWEVC